MATEEDAHEGAGRPTPMGAGAGDSTATEAAEERMPPPEGVGEVAPEGAELATEEVVAEDALEVLTDTEGEVGQADSGAAGARGGATGARAARRLGGGTKLKGAVRARPVWMSEKEAPVAWRWPRGTMASSRGAWRDVSPLRRAKCARRTVLVSASATPKVA